MKYFFLFAFLNSCWIAGAAQEAESNRLIEFFRLHFDSTIVYDSWALGPSTPNYRIIAKKGGEIYFFTYRSPYAWTWQRKVAMPLAKKFMSEEVLFQHTPPDTNRYFLPVYIEQKKGAKTWAALKAMQAWQLQKAEDTAHGCSDIDQTDAGKETFFLLAKGVVKEVDYNTVDLNEQKCRLENIHLQHTFLMRQELRRMLP